MLIYVNTLFDAVLYKIDENIYYILYGHRV